MRCAKAPGGYRHFEGIQDRPVLGVPTKGFVSPFWLTLFFDAGLKGAVVVKPLMCNDTVHKCLYGQARPFLWKGWRSQFNMRPDMTGLPLLVIVALQAVASRVWKDRCDYF